MKRVACPATKDYGPKSKGFGPFFVVQIDLQNTPENDSGGQRKGSISPSARVALYWHFGVRLLKPACSVPTCPHRKPCPHHRAKPKTADRGSADSWRGTSAAFLAWSPLEDLRAPRELSTTTDVARSRSRWPTLEEDYLGLRRGRNELLASLCGAARPMAHPLDSAGRRGDLSSNSRAGVMPDQVRLTRW